MNVESTESIFAEQENCPYAYEQVIHLSLLLIFNMVTWLVFFFFIFSAYLVQVRGEYDILRDIQIACTKCNQRECLFLAKASFMIVRRNFFFCSSIPFIAFLPLDSTRS